jgi:hypothetical protein
MEQSHEKNHPQSDTKQLAAERKTAVVSADAPVIIDAKTGQPIASKGTAATMASCGGRNYAPWGYYGVALDSNCAVFGYPGFRLYYTWATTWWPSAQMCIQGQGYYSGTSSTFYTLGCGEQGAGYVPWGNVALRN